MIVADTNVIAYLYLPGEHTAAAEALLKKHEIWAAPALWRSELRNILASYLRKQLLTLDAAYRIQREAESLIGDAEHQVDSLDVLGLAASSGCSAYDCEFIALAQHLDVRLVTADVTLRRAFPKDTQALSGT